MAKKRGKKKRSRRKKYETAEYIHKVFEKGKKTSKVNQLLRSKGYPNDVIDELIESHKARTNVEVEKKKKQRRKKEEIILISGLIIVVLFFVGFLLNNIYSTGESKDYNYEFVAHKEKIEGCLENTKEVAEERIKELSVYMNQERFKRYEYRKTERVVLNKFVNCIHNLSDNWKDVRFKLIIKEKATIASNIGEKQITFMIKYPIQLIAADGIMEFEMFTIKVENYFAQTEFSEFEFE